MAGEKASVDRDKSYDLINPFTGQPQSAPDAERETAYHDQKEITGTQKHEDPYNNGDEVYNGIKKDTSRIADKRDHLGDAVKKGHMKKLSETTSALKKGSGQAKIRISAQERGLGTGGPGGGSSTHLLAKKHQRTTRTKNKSRTTRVLERPETALRPGQVKVGTVIEAENPMVASAPATSDSPMLGMYSMNPNNSNGSKYNLRSILESIALQAAETFEALDENATIPDAFGSELDQCSKALNKLYSFVTQGQQDSQTGTTPVQGQNFMTKESYLNEAMYHATGYVYPHGEPEKGKEYAVRMSKREIDGMYDPTGNKFLRKVKKDNPHLTHKEAEAIADSGGDEVYKGHPTHTVENDREYKRIYENNDLEEELVGDQHKLDVSGPEGKPDNKLSLHDFKKLGQEAIAKKKLQEAMFGTFAHLVRERKFD